MSLKALLQRPGLLLAGAGVYLGTTAVTYLTFYEPPQEARDAVHAMNNAKRREVFDQNADKYDRDVDLDEKMTGISLMRRFLLRHATGSVLEVAAGTGRNLQYYPNQSTVTLTDFSNGMLSQIPDEVKAKVASCELKIMSADELAFPDQNFDTVVDTFGLCSMDDSVRTLREMQRVCKRGGKILLLEHGRSHYDWLSSVLDKFAGLHVQRWGCHWNRDILDLVEQAGLEVETLHRFHFDPWPQCFTGGGCMGCKWTIELTCRYPYFLCDHNSCDSSRAASFQNRIYAVPRSPIEVMSEVEETLERIKTHKGVEGYVIADRNGNVLRRHPQMQVTEAEKYAAYMKELTTKARGVVRDLNPKNDLQYMRVRMKKVELLVAHEKDFLVVVIQKSAPANN